MANIIDYIRWRGDLSIEAVPLCAPDLAVAATLAYAPFELLPDDSRCGLTLDRICDQLPPAPTGLQTTPNWKEDHLALWDALGKYPRFSGWCLERFVSIFEDNMIDELDQQFCACTFTCGDATIVAFRGTDNTVVGWREDFTMSYEDQVPAQLEAREYLEATLARHRNVYVCGHSKGGNLALFSAATVKDASRIAAVYNFDGPGLVDTVLASEGWAAIKDRTWNYVPESSVFGRIYNRGVELHAVKSDSVSILQHNIYNWHVEGPALVPAPEGLTGSSDVTAKSLLEFVDTTPKEQRKAAVYGLFKLVKASGEDQISDILRSLPTKLPALMKTVELTEEETAGMKRLLGVFARNAGGSVLDSAKEAAESLGDSIGDGISAVVDAAKQRVFGGGLQEKIAQLGETLKDEWEEHVGGERAAEEAPSAEEAEVAEAGEAAAAESQPSSEER